MMNFEKIRLDATFNRDFERAVALHIAEEFMKTGNEFFKKRFENHYELSKRWEWARVVADWRLSTTNNEFKEHREAYPKFFRVRPQ